MEGGEKVRFWREEPPGGTIKEPSPEYVAGMRAMESWYHEFVIWAYAYISLLEKRLQECTEVGKHGDEQGEK